MVVNAIAPPKVVGMPQNWVEFSNHITLLEIYTVLQHSESTSIPLHRESLLVHEPTVLCNVTIPLVP